VRQRTLSNFRDGRTTVLVATDIAARGIDVDEITHVVNFDMPNEPETYVHRIGRTGRAGASGLAISFCDHEERNELKSIERLLKRPIVVHDDQPAYAAVAPLPPAPNGSAGADRHSRPGNGPRKSKHWEPKPERTYNDSRPARSGNNGTRTAAAPAKAFSPLSRHKTRTRPH
jgi:ATP-dependent RNA helicase RhlE